MRTTEETMDNKTQFVVDEVKKNKEVSVHELQRLLREKFGSGMDSTVLLDLRAQARDGVEQPKRLSRRVKEGREKKPRPRKVTARSLTEAVPGPTAEDLPRVVQNAIQTLADAVKTGAAGLKFISFDREDDGSVTVVSEQEVVEVRRKELSL